MRPFSNISRNFAANLHLLVDSIFLSRKPYFDKFCCSRLANPRKMSYLCVIIDH